MNVEIEFIKKSLEAFRNSEMPYLNIKEFTIKVCLNHSKSDDLKKAFHYLLLLKDQNLISGVNLRPEQQDSLGFSFYANGTIISANHSVLLRLTNEGHKVLEVLSQSKFWEASKKIFKEFGKEGLKLIPSLAIEYFKG